MSTGPCVTSNLSYFLLLSADCNVQESEWCSARCCENLIMSGRKSVLGQAAGIIN